MGYWEWHFWWQHRHTHTCISDFWVVCHHPELPCWCSQDSHDEPSIGFRGCIFLSQLAWLFVKNCESRRHPCSLEGILPYMGKVGSMAICILDFIWTTPPSQWPILILVVLHLFYKQGRGSFVNCDYILPSIPSALDACLYRAKLKWKWSLPSQACCSLDRDTNEIFWLAYVSQVLTDVMFEPSHHFWKCNRNPGCRYSFSFRNEMKHWVADDHYFGGMYKWCRDPLPQRDLLTFFFYLHSVWSVAVEDCWLEDSMCMRCSV